MATKKYVTAFNSAGQYVHTRWRVWRGGEYGTGYTSFDDEEEAFTHYNMTGAARIDCVVTTILDSRD